jgi:hypothetical protein
VTGGRVKRFKPFPVQNGSKQIQIFSNFDQLEKCLSLLEKIEIKYGFEELGEMNNFLHINFSRFRIDLELKFKESLG